MRLRPAAAWLLGLILLSCGSGPPKAPPAAVPEIPALRERESWMGVYLRGAKIGWSRSRIQRVSEGRYRLAQETFMRIPAMGTVQECAIDFNVEFSGEFDPYRFDFSMKTPAFTTTAEGEVRDGVLHTTVRTPQSERREEFTLGEDNDLFGLSDLRRAAEGYKVGYVHEGEIFDPNIFGLTPYRIEVLDSEVIRSGATSEVVYRVRTVVSGVEAMSVVAENGDLITSDGPMGITLKREDERSAKDLDRSTNTVDLILAFSVDAGRTVPAPASVRRAVFQVEGLDDSVVSGGVQAVSAADSAGRRTVIVDLDAPVRDVVAGDGLNPSPWIQSEDSRVVEKAREIVGDARTPAEKVKRIFDWVRSRMRQEPAFTLPSTLDVLESLRGDCNEHAALFCGLARAAGVPARTASGVAYLDGRFYYHAWNEVALDGCWIPVDATFKENPAGALRLRLEIGDLDQALGIAAYAGKIKITILEAEGGGTR